MSCRTVSGNKLSCLSTHCPDDAGAQIRSIGAQDAMWVNVGVISPNIELANPEPDSLFTSGESMPWKIRCQATRQVSMFCPTGVGRDDTLPAETPCCLPCLQRWPPTT